MHYTTFINLIIGSPNSTPSITLAKLVTELEILKSWREEWLKQIKRNNVYCNYPFKLTISIKKKKEY